MEQKHYMDIQAFRPAFMDGFKPGDSIIIQEKIDGANFSIRYDEETDTVKSFSRRKELLPAETLRGAYTFAMSLDKELVKSVLGRNLILFGEWLVPHTVKYPKEAYSKAYFYDVFDNESKRYLHQDVVEDIVKRLHLNYVPTFYKGEFQSWEHVMEYVGKTQMGGEYGEGVVVKNQSRVDEDEAFVKVPFYTKIVAEKFKETKGQREERVYSPEELAAIEKIDELTKSVVTEARVRKELNKMVDEGILPEDWCNTDMKIVAKNLPKRIFDDCIKEELDTIELINSVGGDFGKRCSSVAMYLAKEVLNERMKAF